MTTVSLNPEHPSKVTVHSLPCKIKYTGKSNVSDWFPEQDPNAKIPNACGIDGSIVDNELQQQKYSHSRPSSYFRGRAVLKKTVQFDKGIRGFKLNKVQTASNTESVWSTEGTFKHINVWSLTTKSRTKHEQSVNNWFKLSAAINGDVQQKQVEECKDDKDDKDDNNMSATTDITESKESEEFENDQNDQIHQTTNESNEPNECIKSKESTKTSDPQKPQNAPKPVPEDIHKTVKALSFADWEGNDLKVTTMRFLEEDRLQIYGAKNESIKTAQFVLAVECVPDEDDDDEDSDCEDDNDQELSETIVVIDNEGKGSKVEMMDKIMYEEVSPSSLIEYTFNSEGGEWMLAPMGLMSLEGYRRSKFSNWKQMIEHPVCEAAFKRLLNIGLITNMFDNVAFPSPEHEEKEWVVKDEHDRDVVIPRPVQALRIWNVKRRGYDAVRAHLDGAPSAEEAEEYWQGMIKKFKDEQGEEYIDGLLKAFDKKGDGN